MPGTQVATSPRPVVPGYHVEELLGAGATGSVWAAVRATDGAPVAVKVVPVRAGGPEAERAAREVGVLASVDVEGLVRFHEAIGLPGDPSAVAIVLDRVRGGSLHRAVTARGHLSVGESVTILTTVARALAGLHAAGVVHGDVSPTNVLLELSGRPLLSDLGVARLAGERPGELFATAGFVAPEVLEGAPPTPASDVYAVGALAWWCVTGGAPGPAALRRPLEELAPGLPEEWRAATTAALGGVPEQRPSAADLALAYYDSATCEALRLVVGTDETSLLTTRLRSAPASTPEPAPAPAGRRLSRLRVPSPPRPKLSHAAAGSRPGRALRAVLVLATVLATVLAAVLAARALALGPPDPPALPSTSAARSPGGLVADHGSVRRDPRGLMQELSDLRAHAMNTASSADLARLDAPGSPALAADLATLDRLRRSRSGYAGVDLRVRSATVLTVTADRADVRAVVDTAAYDVVPHSGPASPQPARAGEPMRFTLRWVDTRWQVERVGAA